MTKTRNDSHLWACLIREFWEAGRPNLTNADAEHYARRAVALVRRERAAGNTRTFAPGEDIPLDVMRAYDLDGDIWVRQSGDPASTLKDSWKMPGFDPGQHEGAAGGVWITPWLLDNYGPLTEM